MQLYCVLVVIVSFNECILLRCHFSFTHAHLKMQAESSICGRNVTPARLDRKKKYTDAEVLVTLISDEEEFSDCSSTPDSVSSGDEADFFIYPFQEPIEDDGDPLEPSEPPCSTQEPSVPICKGKDSKEDEDDFLEGIEPQQDTVEDVKEQLELSEPSVPICRWRSCGRRTYSRGCRSRSRRSSGKGCTLEAAPNYSGVWKTEKDPDHLPHSPHPFLPKRKPGVQPPLSTSVKNPRPIELFKMYFDMSAIKTLCVNTNKKAAKNIAAGKNFKWTEITADELCKYIGLTLYMGILRLPKLRDFWRVKSIFHVPYPQKVMSRDRFLGITWNMHLSDPAKDAINDRKKGTDEYDRLHRLRPLYDSLRVACKTVYHPVKNLSVDERMEGTKARISLKQCIKNKPTKWGIKLFVLCDSSGYTVDFNIYTGKSSVVSGKGLLFDVVMSLVRTEFLGSGYHIYCDNFYTSPVLFQHLYNLGFGACGTIRDTQIGVPKTNENALTGKSPQGSIRWIRQGSLLFTKWMDTREVSVCTTLHTAYSGDTVKRVCKSSSGYKNMDVPVPTAVKDYNRFMGRVDISDQLIGCYSSWKKSRKWYMTVLHHFVDIAIANSYLLHKQLCSSKQKQPMTHQAFQEQLTAELCGVSLQPACDSYQHLPVTISDTVGSKKATQGRRKCRLCGKCTPFMCEACQLPLCVILDRNCHKSYHS